jgi:hypothetical protein
VNKFTMNRKLSTEERDLYFRSGGNMTTITEMLLTYLWNVFQTVYLHLDKLFTT